MQAGIAFDLIPPSDRLKLLDMIGAVVYIRVSTKEQTENLSSPTQLRACEDYCRREGYEVLERFWVWQERRATVKKEIDQVDRNAKSIQQKLDRLDNAFIFAQAIDLETYERQRDRLREELTLTRIDRHGSQLEELDVEGIMAFAERVLPRASDLWIQSSLDQRQRLQQLFFPEGVAFNRNQFDPTAVTSSAFMYLRPVEGSKKDSVAQIFTSWNPLMGWVRQIEALRSAA
jgi:hypothetical protein